VSQKGEEEKGEGGAVRCEKGRRTSKPLKKLKKISQLNALFQHKGGEAISGGHLKKKKELGKKEESMIRSL